MLLVPSDLETGVYRLKVITQYAASKHLLKTPRETVYVQELTVI
jgi:hypothetical protein